ncbi:hypothetical protein ASPFODRAFT_54369 [Aspergillus luchuensis CBS 106.47]|uniref:Invertebrate defensins family profile domain-containing protein n=1 Tax=Aspergillus luchuensis (strain CBS 106.47) TaxID=1137211 RepID=A0A1M3SZG2_ASPLC|nr:hypothetical protein ASPFODRAFT_54369 [Aspergillus luchuensis CBS 106.47]
MKLFSIISTALFVAAVAATPLTNEGEARDSHEVMKREIEIIKRDCPTNSAAACCQNCGATAFFSLDGSSFDSCCKSCGC